MWHFILKNLLLRPKYAYLAPIGIRLRGNQYDQIKQDWLPEGNEVIELLLIGLFCFFTDDNDVI